jgi:hypothetical protein
MLKFLNVSIFYIILYMQELKKCAKKTILIFRTHKYTHLKLEILINFNNALILGA